MGEHKIYTKEILISELHRYKEIYGEIPSADEINEVEEFPTAYYFIKIFGSWNNALKAADMVSKKNKMNKEFLISELQRYHNEFGVIPTTRMIEKNPDYPSPTTFKKHFLTWNNALEESGLEKIHLSTNERKQSKESLINEIKRFYDEFNRVPVAKDFTMKDGYPAYTTFTKYFNSFEDAIETFKSKYDIMDSKSNDEIENRKKFLKSEFIRFYEEFDELPSTKAFATNKDYPSSVSYYKLYDSWYDALVDAGFTEYALINYKHHNAKMSDDFLISELHRFKDEFGIEPTMKMINEASGYPFASPYINHFGSWKNAMEKAGFKIKNKFNEYDDEVLIARLYDYIKEFGELPTVNAFAKSNGYPSVNTYFKHFGSWNNVLKLVGYDKNKNIEKTEVVQKIIKESLFSYVKGNKKIPSFEEFTTNENISKIAITKNFTSYKNFIISSGFYYEESKIDFSEITNEELIDLLYEYQDEFGKIPTAKSINDNMNYPSFNLYQSRFGSWNDAIEIAGFA